MTTDTEDDFHILAVETQEGGCEMGYVNDEPLSLELAKAMIAAIHRYPKSYLSHPLFNTDYFIVYGRDD